MRRMRSSNIPACSTPTMPAVATLAAAALQPLLSDVCSLRPNSPAANYAGAKRLAARGAVLVAGDAGSEADLRAAFAGAWGVFAMTFVHAVTGTQDAAIEEEYALGALSTSLASCAVAPVSNHAATGVAALIITVS